MKSILLWAAAQACLVHAISPPDAPPIPVLRSTGFAGSGCPQSSDTIVQFRNNVLTLSTPELVSSSGSRSVCTTQIELTNTSGWQFAINQVLMNGQANMSADSRGSVNLNVFYSGYIQAQVRAQGLSYSCSLLIDLNRRRVEMSISEDPIRLTATPACSLRSGQLMPPPTRPT